jgi:hypothetical protein
VSIEPDLIKRFEFLSINEYVVLAFVDFSTDIPLTDNVSSEVKEMLAFKRI